MYVRETQNCHHSYESFPCATRAWRKFGIENALTCRKSHSDTNLPLRSCFYLACGTNVEKLWYPKQIWRQNLSDGETSLNLVVLRKVWLFEMHCTPARKIWWFTLTVKYIDCQSGWPKSMIKYFAPEPRLPDDGQTAATSRLTYYAINKREQLRDWGLNSQSLQNTVLTINMLLYERAVYYFAIWNWILKETETTKLKTARRAPNFFRVSEKNQPSLRAKKVNFPAGII